MEFITWLRKSHMDMDDRPFPTRDIHINVVACVQSSVDLHDSWLLLQSIVPILHP